MAIKDEEGLLKSLQAYGKSNLNTKITAINTEKADFTIKTIDADDRHYVFGGELLELPNDMFVNYSIVEDIETLNIHDDIRSIVNFMIEVAFDHGKKPNEYFKSLRYMRALYDTYLNYEPSTSEVDGLKITKAVPMLVASKGRSLVVSGIGLSASIG